MPKMVKISEKSAKLRALFPTGEIGVWQKLPAGFEGMLLDNGSVDLRRKVRMVEGHDVFGWRIDRVTASGNEKFIGYTPMTDSEAALY